MNLIKPEGYDSAAWDTHGPEMRQFVVDNWDAHHQILRDARPAIVGESPSRDGAVDVLGDIIPAEILDPDATPESLVAVFADAPSEPEPTLTTVAPDTVMAPAPAIAFVPDDAPARPSMGGGAAEGLLPADVVSTRTIFDDIREANDEADRMAQGRAWTSTMMMTDAHEPPPGLTPAFRELEAEVDAGRVGTWGEPFDSQDGAGVPAAPESGVVAAPGSGDSPAGVGVVKPTAGPWTREGDVGWTRTALGPNGIVVARVVEATFDGSAVWSIAADGYTPGRHVNHTDNVDKGKWLADLALVGCGWQFEDEDSTPPGIEFGDFDEDDGDQVRLPALELARGHGERIHDATKAPPPSARHVQLTLPDGRRLLVLATDVVGVLSGSHDDRNADGAGAWVFVGGPSRYVVARAAFGIDAPIGPGEVVIAEVAATYDEVRDALGQAEAA